VRFTQQYTHIADFVESAKSSSTNGVSRDENATLNPDGRKIAVDVRSNPLLVFQLAIPPLLWEGEGRVRVEHRRSVIGGARVSKNPRRTLT
jgi:hypothetical protein